VRKLDIDLRGLVHLGKMSGGYFVTTFVNNAIPILVLPILTRFLAPEQYANITLFGFYLALANALTGASLPTVVTKHFFDSAKKDIAALIGNSLLLALAFSLAAMLLIGITYPSLKMYFNMSLPWLLLIPPASLAFNVFSIGLAVMRNEKKKLCFSKHQIANTAINIVISVVLVAVLLWGWQGRVWGVVLSYFISALAMYSYLKANGYISFAISKKVLKNILSLVLPLLPNSFQSIIISQIGIFFIQFYFTKKLLGIYAVGFQVAFAVRLLNTTLALSWSPYLYEQIANANAVNRMYLARMLLALTAIMFAGVAFINIFSETIVRFMSGSRYLGAKEFIPWFTIGFFFQGLYIFLSPFLIKFAQQRYVSSVSFMNMIIMIVLNVWWVRVFGYMGVAYAFAIVYFLMFLAFVWRTQRVFPLPWLRAVKIWN